MIITRHFALRLKFLTAAALAGTSTYTLADEAPNIFVDNGMFPNIGMDWDSSIQYDHVDPSGDEDSDDFFVDLNPVIFLRFSPNSEIWLDVELAPLDPPEPGQHRFMDDLGLVINDINYLYSGHKTWFRIGKYQIPFGRAWEDAPGLYTEDFVDDYNFDGLLGGVVGHRYNAGRLGIFEPIAGVHFVDTTFFSRTFFQGGDRTKKSDGGPANTERPESFFTVVNWTAIPALPNLSTQVGFIHNAEGKGEEDESSEQAYTVSASYPISVAGGDTLFDQLSGRYVELLPFVEYVKFDDADGIRNAEKAYLTTSLTLNWGQWGVGLTRTDTDYGGIMRDEPNDYINELSVGYAFTRLFSLQVGLGTSKTDGVESDFVGMNLNWSMSF